MDVARLGYPNELGDRFHHVRAIALDLHQQALEQFGQDCKSVE